ncbi:MAG: hypothetical protein AAF328_02645 [Planctomycetota bacterium]
MPTRTIRCPAKLNLTLAVGPSDASEQARGRHPVASLMVALDFGDTLRLTQPRETSRFDRRWAEDAPHTPPIDWPLESDLLVKAHAAVEADCGFKFPVQAQLDKRVPPGTGLGGGSADAAAMLFALETDLAERFPQTQVDLPGIAARLGADVSFALHALQHPDRPAALATGFGEHLEPFALPRTLHAALVLPDFGCPTAKVYAAFDKLTPNAPPVDLQPTQRVIEQLQAGATLADVAPFNDLTEAAEHVQPKLTHLLGVLRDAGLNPHLTGSGAAVFLPAVDAKQAALHAEHAARLTGHPALPVQTASE